MAEDVARAVGAGEGVSTVLIAGKECSPHPLGVRQLTEVERECLNRYKRSYLQTFSENKDLLPDGEGDRLLLRKMEEVAKWDVSDLPLQWAYDSKEIKVTPKLRRWMEENLNIKESKVGQGQSRKEFDVSVQRYVAAALDEGILSDTLYENLCGIPPKKLKVGYVQWWITGTYDGRITMVHACFKDTGITRAEIEQEFQKASAALTKLSNEIESLSVPAVGNG